MKRTCGIGVLLLALACASAPRPPPDEPTEPPRSPTKLVAESTCDNRAVRLELTDPDRFTLTLHDQVTDRTYVHSTDVPAIEGSHRYRFVERWEIPPAFTMYPSVSYEFESTTSPRVSLQIHTRIQTLDEDLRWYMDVDRPPYAFVFIAGDSAPAVYPLNREGAPESERFQASGPIPFERDGEYGYMDKSGTRVVIEPRFEQATRFRHGLAVVKLDGKCGYADETGVLAIAPRFDSCSDFGIKGVDGLAVVRVNGKEGMIDRAGAYVIPLSYDGFGQFFEHGIIPMHVNSRYGFIDRSGQIVLDPEYECVGRFSGPLAPVQVKGKYGFVDTTGKFRIVPTYAAARNFRDRRAPVQVASGKWGYIDDAGALRIPATFDRADEFWGGLARVALGGGTRRKYGFVDVVGSVVVPIRYDETGVFNGGSKCRAVLDGQEGWLYVDGRFESWD